MNLNQNYFEALGLPIDYDISEEQLANALYDRMKLAHPDQHPGVQGEQKQDIEQRARYLNQAYTTLRNKASRLQYIMNLTHPELNSIDLHVYLPKQFLEQTIEWHEWLSQSHTQVEVEDKLHEIKCIEEECYVDCAISDLGQELLATYAQIKFIQRFKRQLQNKLEAYEF